MRSVRLGHDRHDIEPFAPERPQRRDREVGRSEENAAHYLGVDGSGAAVTSFMWPVSPLRSFFHFLTNIRRLSGLR